MSNNPTPVPIYRVGGLIRVNVVHSEDNHGLEVGSVVTIASVGVDPSGRAFARVIPGDVAIFLSDTTPVATHDELHPEDAMPDDAVDKQFDLMTDLYAHEFYGKSVDEVAAMIAAGEDGAVEDNRPVRLPDVEQAAGDLATLDRPAGEQARRTTPYSPDAREDIFTLTDRDGDVVEFIYFESDYTEKSMDGYIRVRINGTSGVDIPMQVLPALARFFGTRAAKFLRRRKARERGIR